MRQAYLRDSGAVCDHNIPCEPVRRRMPVILARWSWNASRVTVSCSRSTSQVITVGFACARRDKQLQWRTLTDWQPQRTCLNLTEPCFEFSHDLLLFHYYLRQRGYVLAAFVSWFVCLLATEQIFTNILPETCLWTRKYPLNFGRNPDPGIMLDPPWHSAFRWHLISCMCARSWLYT